MESGGAVAMLVRVGWRRYWRSSLFLAVAAGLAAGVVGASFQAAGRSGSTLDRFLNRSRVYDAMVQGCPPGVDPEVVQNSQAALQRFCVNPAVTARLRPVVQHLEGVEQTAVASTFVVALLDPSVSNHWGRLTLLAAMRSVDEPSPPLRPIVVSGRLYRPDARDEIVISEGAAHATGLRTGDTVRMSGWRQADLDAAIDGFRAPETTPFTAKVVGVIRGIDDVQGAETGSLSNESIPGDINVLAGPGWAAAHSTGLSGYGSGVTARVRGGPSGLQALQAQLQRSPGGWFTQVSPFSNVDLKSVRQVLDLQRRALLVFAAIAILASLAFIGLTTGRQLRRESAAWSPLIALGMTRRGRRGSNVVRALTIAAPACAVALTTLIALSPFGPVGLARKLEYHLGVRVDIAVLAATLAALLLVFAVAGLVAPVGSDAEARPRARARTARWDPGRMGLGPVAVVGANIARGRSSRTAVAVTAVAVAAAVGAGGLVASYDRLTRDPQRYGAWWDVAVGQYSERRALDGGIAKVKANPNVIAAAGYDEQTDIAKVDGRKEVIFTFDDYVGHRGPIIARGRAPAADDEAALGRATADAIHKGIGDVVTVVGDNDRKVRAHVVGIVVVNDPITSQARAGNGVYLRPGPLAQIAGPQSVAQSIVIALDPRRDRTAALESVRHDFAGSIRAVSPQTDVRNLGRLRTTPWLIVLLVAMLAIATLVHALVTMLGRHRMTFAVVAALGLTRRQRRGIGLFAGAGLIVFGVVLGIPIGLLLTDRLWRVVTAGIDLPSPTATAWRTILVTPIAALAVTAIVALVASRRTLSVNASQQLHVE